MAIAVTKIILGSDAETVRGEYEDSALSVGKAMYLDNTSGGKWKPAKSSGTALEAGSAKLAISLNAGNDVETSGHASFWLSGTGKIDTLGVTAKGTIYILGGTAGEIETVADQASGEYTTIVGVGGTEGLTTNTFDEFTLKPYFSNRQLA